MKKDLKKEIINKIKKESIKPIPKSFFSWKNRLLWLIILIILIFLWIIFSFLYNDLLDFNEVWLNNENNKLFFIPNIFWWSIIITLLILWFINYRKTKYWYKQSNFLVISFITVLTVFLWSFFIFTSYWRYFQDDLVNNSTFLKNYVYQENLWNNPKIWKLVWTIIESKEDKLIFKDISWKTWEIDTKNSFIWNNVKLLNDEKIRIIWSMQDENTFIAEKIIPYFWMWDWKGNRYWKWWNF